MLRRPLLVPLILLSACQAAETSSSPPANEIAEPAPVEQPAPAFAPPASEAAPDVATPAGESSAEAAAAVAKAYYAAIEAGRYADAWAMRWEGGDESEFVESFARYAEYHATVGAPGQMQGAAGSSYVEVPVQTYGRLKSGEPFSSAGTVTLRRVNDVPGSTAAQRRWRIYSRG